MPYDIRSVQNINHLITYFSKVLKWDIDIDSFDDIDDISYDFSASDLGLKEEAFAKIKSIKQLPPMVDGQKWGIFCIEFDSKRFEVTALRKVLSGLVPSRRNSADHAVWRKEDLLFLCFWGEDNNRTIGVAHFEDKQNGLPQIKITYCAPAVEDTVHIREFTLKIDNLTWPVEVYNFQKWHDDWSKAFTTCYKQVIHDSQTLTMQLASEAIGIRDRILETLKVETEEGYVHQLYNKFKETLIHDMSEKSFADMYAQTVVYGLFSARCMDNTQEDFSADEAVECIPNTNPFLKSLMKECLGSRDNSKLSFDELEIGNVIDLLMHTNTDAIIKDFNRQTGGGKEDPVIHFYEEFLAEYDKTQKVQKGVYYTPQPVVNFIVRSVDTILKKELEITDGLASEETKRVKYLRESKKKTDGYYYKTVEDYVDVPSVQILDPATGTGTFLRQTILQIYENFKEMNKGCSPLELKEAWNKYVPECVLPRINAFELMMAPYAVAHMKLAMILQDTGYEFNNSERLKVFLTNSLEEAGNSNKQIAMWDDPLAMESLEANIVKQNNAINIVIGNPPYAGESSNKGKWILSLIEDYKKEPGGLIKLNEKNPKWINDDYVKFIRLAQLYIERAQKGVMGYICPHGFIDNPTFRGMRWNLASTFDSIYVLDLHGNTKKRETDPDGNKDENVFDIQQGVCILFLIRKSSRRGNSLADIYHADLFGTRKNKYTYLNFTGFNEVKWTKVNSKEPFYIFKPMQEIDTHYERFDVSSLFVQSVMGFQTHRDNFAISFEKKTIEERVKDMCNPSLSDNLLKEKYSISDNRDWQVDKARNRLTNLSSEKTREKITLCQYRLFDTRWCFLDESFMDYPRGNVFCNVTNKDNYVFGVGRQGLAVGDIEWCLCTVSRFAMDANIFRRGGITASPLYIYDDDRINGNKRRPNLSPEIVAEFESKTEMKFVSEYSNDSNSFSPIDILDYVLAILYSHRFRLKFKDELKIDYPKIPYPHNKENFNNVRMLGSRLRELLTMETTLDSGDFSFSGGDSVITKYKLENNRIYISKDGYFKCLNDQIHFDDLWNYNIGGNQPLQKWLKDRKGQELSSEDISHYLQILSSIQNIIQIMNEIDEIIDL